MSEALLSDTQAGCYHLTSWRKDELQQAQRQSRDTHTFVKGRPLTVLPVVGDLHLALLGPEHGLGDLADGLFAGQVSVEEVAGAGLLHDVGSGEARHLTEAIVTVDDCTVLHSGIGYDKFPVCIETKYVPGSILTHWSSQSSCSSFKQADDIQHIGGHLYSYYSSYTIHTQIKTKRDSYHRCGQHLATQDLWSVLLQQKSASTHLLWPSNFRIINPRNVFCGATWPLLTGMFTRRISRHLQQKRLHK